MNEARPPIDSGSTRWSRSGPSQSVVHLSPACSFWRPRRKHPENTQTASRKQFSQRTPNSALATPDAPSTSNPAPADKPLRMMHSPLPSLNWPTASCTESSLASSPSTRPPVASERRKVQVQLLGTFPSDPPYCENAPPSQPLLPLNKTLFSKRPTPFSGTFQNRHQALAGIASGRRDSSASPFWAHALNRNHNPNLPCPGFLHRHSPVVTFSHRGANSEKVTT
jgi:hypothetical protein